MPGLAVPRVVFAHDELAVGIRFRLADFDDIVLAVRQNRIVVLNGTVAAAQHTLGNNRPGIRV